MTLTPLTTVREAMQRWIARLAASVMQRPLRAEGHPEASPAPEPPPLADPDYLSPQAPSQLLSALDTAYLHEVLANLVQACERLFHDDWVFTLCNIRDNYTML